AITLGQAIGARREIAVARCDEWSSLHGHYVLAGGDSVLFRVRAQGEPVLLVRSVMRFQHLEVTKTDRMEHDKCVRDGFALEKDLAAHRGEFLLRAGSTQESDTR